MALPMPRLAPVTSAIRLANFFMFPLWKMNTTHQALVRRVRDFYEGLRNWKPALARAGNHFGASGLCSASYKATPVAMLMTIIAIRRKWLLPAFSGGPPWPVPTPRGPCAFSAA